MPYQPIPQEARTGSRRAELTFREVGKVTTAFRVNPEFCRWMMAKFGLDDVLDFLPCIQSYHA
jgi:hypothetical protein